MMKTLTKGYVAPWSSRRETVGLMGTLILFLFGLPGHSEPMMQSAKHMISQLIQLMLVFLGLTTPAVHQPPRRVFCVPFCII